jgi:hypothetical protein
LKALGNAIELRNKNSTEEIPRLEALKDKVAASLGDHEEFPSIAAAQEAVIKLYATNIKRIQ